MLPPRWRDPRCSAAFSETPDTDDGGPRTSSGNRTGRHGGSPPRAIDYAGEKSTFSFRALPVTAAVRRRRPRTASSGFPPCWHSDSAYDLSAQAQARRQALVPFACSTCVQLLLRAAIV